MKPDLIICWIKHSDYPLFRLFLKRHRDFFGKIIIYWSEHFRHMYYDKFIQSDLEKLGNIQFLHNIEYQYGKEDWRNIATNYMLKHTNSEWVCSIEQDWFAKDWDRLLLETEKAMQTSDMVGWMNETRASYVHPAYWFIKRELLEKTQKDFSPHPEITGSDHFGTITYDAQKLGAKIITLQQLGFKTEVQPNTDAFHLGGVNQNYLEGLKPNFVFHRPDWFCVYNWWSLKADVSMDKQFTNLILDIHNKLKVALPEIDPETDSRSIYFK